MIFLFWLLVPLWIFVCSFVIKLIFDLTSTNKNWWSFPTYMALGLPSILIAMFVTIALVFVPIVISTDPSFFK